MSDYIIEVARLRHASVRPFGIPFGVTPREFWSWREGFTPGRGVIDHIAWMMLKKLRGELRVDRFTREFSGKWGEYNTFLGVAEDYSTPGDSVLLRLEGEIPLLPPGSHAWKLRDNGLYAFQPDEGTPVVRSHILTYSRHTLSGLLRRRPRNV